VVLLDDELDADRLDDDDVTDELDELDELAEDAELLLELLLLELLELLLLDRSSAVKLRRHRRKPYNFPPVRSAVPIVTLTAWSSVALMAVAADPTGTISCNPAVPLVASTAAASTSLAPST
jgi:hypothetical protein